jgi:hypothetical protein
MSKVDMLLNGFPLGRFYLKAVGLGFTLEARHASGVLRKGRRQNLDCDLAIQPGVGAAVDGARAAFPELGDDAIVRDRLHVQIEADYAKSGYWVSFEFTTEKTEITEALCLRALISLLSLWCGHRGKLTTTQIGCELTLTYFAL